MSLFTALAGKSDDDGPSDLSEAAQAHERRSFFTHLAALTLSKSADGLINPKLVLSGLLVSLGAPAGMTGLLAPIREAGALLPQILVAGWLNALKRRKWVWSLGAAGQAVSALGVLACALLLHGAAAGGGILACLAALAVSRSLCSAAYKDVLGKTVDQARRGRTTGLAGTLSAVVAFSFAALLTLDLVDGAWLLKLMIALAALAWMAAGLAMTQLPEQPTGQAQRHTQLSETLAELGPALRNREFRYFMAARAALAATSFAPPFFVLSLKTDAGLGAVGALILAASAAGFLSAYVWGGLSDRSSRKTLIAAAALGSGVLAASAWGSTQPAWDWPWIPPAALFALMIAYQGVRLGRSTHLVDMSDETRRAIYTALSNTLMGVFLLTGGAFAWLAQAYGASAALAALAGLCALALWPAWRLTEAQE